MKQKNIPQVSVEYAADGSSKRSNELGMRAMQERAFNRRGEQYLLIKAPPASGKSRAVMFIALDKIYKQGLRQGIIVVPERSIGSSFNNEPLSKYGFWHDWEVVPKWNLCSAPGDGVGMVNSFSHFLESKDKFLICTHATFRFAVEKLGLECLDNRFIAIDEVHHVSANPDNKLGYQLRSLIDRGKCHLTAMTGSYFRGDSEAVLTPEDEALFDIVSYTYFEQLNGYEFLKRLDIGYSFYSGSYLDEIMMALNPEEKTIIHIPNVNARESTKDKIKEVESLMNQLGDWEGTDPDTGFQLIKTTSGKILKIADLVDDETATRDKVISSLKRPEAKSRRDHVYIIIALGMAKEGFDWIWCEHALTVGYRASLTEIIQIIGRATRDAPGKIVAKFTNLIAEPDASQSAVTEAVNDTLKAIAASLLMEQVLTPKFEFTPKSSGPQKGLDYGADGYRSESNNVGFNSENGQIQIEIGGLVEPKSPEAKRICAEDMSDVVAAFLQDKSVLARGIFDSNMPAEESTQIHMGRIVKNRYAFLPEEDQEAIRQRAVALINVTQQAKATITSSNDIAIGNGSSFVDGVRKFAMDVRDLDIDLIDRINMSEESLREVATIIASKKISMTEEEARQLAIRAKAFLDQNGRLPSLTSTDQWEKRMAEGVEYLKRLVAKKKNNE
jgi:hypothetical protein